MFCENCGKEIKDSEKFCQNCGQPISQMNSTSQTYSNVRNKNNISETKGKKIVEIIGIIVVVVIIAMIIKNNISDTKPDGEIGVDKEINTGLKKVIDVEYSNNAGMKLPITVDGVSIDSAWGFTDITLQLTNLTDRDYRELCFVFMAWDENGLPINLEGMYEYDGGDYLRFLSVDNMAANSTKEVEWSITQNDNISYVSVFLVSYTDFDGVEWENPILDDVREMGGKPLEDVPIYYYSIN